MKKLVVFGIFFLLFTIKVNIMTSGPGGYLTLLGLDPYLELSPTYYPKAVAYLEDLKEIYPQFKSTSMFISLKYPSPHASFNAIYFPKKWILLLEAGNQFYIQATEWVILHEYGHIDHRDSYKALAVPGLFSLWKIMMSSLINSFDFLPDIITSKSKEKETVKSVTNNVLFGGPFSWQFIISTGVYFIYWFAIKEYQADDYAMQHCDNAQAWIAAYEFLDRIAPLGLYAGFTHSFKKYRLSRIKAGFKKKFGYELIVVPHSINEADYPV